MSDLGAAVITHLDEQLESSRRLLNEIQREHIVNRALMRQELSFLDHLVRLVGAEEEPGYRPPGELHGNGARASAPAQTHRVLDLRA